MAADPAPEPIVREAKDFIPTRKYAPVKGTSVGILVSKVPLELKPPPAASQALMPRQPRRPRLQACPPWP